MWQVQRLDEHRNERGEVRTRGCQASTTLRVNAEDSRTSTNSLAGSSSRASVGSSDANRLVATARWACGNVSQDSVGVTPASSRTRPNAAASSGSPY